MGDILPALTKIAKASVRATAASKLTNPGQRELQHPPGEKGTKQCADHQNNGRPAHQVRLNARCSWSTRADRARRLTTFTSTTFPSLPTLVTRLASLLVGQVSAAAPLWERSLTASVQGVRQRSKVALTPALQGGDPEGVRRAQGQALIRPRCCSRAENAIWRRKCTMGRMHCMEALLDESSDAQAGSKCVPAFYGGGGLRCWPLQTSPQPELHHLSPLYAEMSIRGDCLLACTVV
jgi:hypothetical protein